MGRLNFAELLLVLVVMQQLLAAGIWVLSVRLRVAPRIPSRHWTAASLWAASCAALTLTHDPLGDWFAFGLPALLLPGAFILTRLGLQILFRAGRNDAEHILVIVLALLCAGGGAWAGAPMAWTHAYSSLLCCYCLLRCAACVREPARRELGERGAFLVLLPQQGVAVMFAVRVAVSLLWPETFARLMTDASLPNVVMLMGYLCISVVFQLMLGLTVAMRLVARLQTLSRLDPLTGLCNRRGLEERWAALSAHAPYSVLAIDADHFKRVNDEHGHAVGDQALQHLAELMRRCVRPSDTVARLGGEEFLVLYPHTDVEHALERAEGLRALVERSPMRMGEKSLGLTVSVGVAGAAVPLPAASLIAEADLALYEAKRQGRNRVCTADPDPARESVYD